MFKLFLITLLCVAVLAQTEPGTNNERESKSGEIWNHIKGHIKSDMERLKERINEHRHHHRQSSSTPNPTGTSTLAGTPISS